MTKPKHPSEYKKLGRPGWPYDDYIAEEICEAIATTTLPMCKILAENPHFPSEKVIRTWRYKIPKFSQMWLEAKRLQAELFVEECLPIADDELSEVDRARLRIDTRKWIGCKLASRIYGDKVQVEDVDASTKKAAKEIKEFVDRLKENEQPY